MSSEDADPPFPFQRDRGAGPGGGGRGVPDHRSMRMGRLPRQGFGEALAGGSPLAGYPDADKGELL